MHRRHSTIRNNRLTAGGSSICVDASCLPNDTRTMTLTNKFIAELVLDANRLGLLDAYQKRRMLERAVATIRDLREIIGMPSGPGRDRVLDIHTLALSIENGWHSEEEVRDAFLSAAGMIRDLHIILSSKTEISFVGSGE